MIILTMRIIIDLFRGGNAKTMSARYILFFK